MASSMESGKSAGKSRGKSVGKSEKAVEDLFAPPPAWKRQTWPLWKGVMDAGFLALSGRVWVRGAENIPHTGGVLICPNHVSSADPPAISVTCPRQPHFMIMASLFEKPLVKSLVRLALTFPVKQEGFDRAALRHAEELLRAGEVVVIFPEGNGNHESVLHPLFPGAMMLAMRTQVPVIPTAIFNTGKLWDYNDSYPKRSQRLIEVEYGTPMDLEPLYDTKGAIEAGTRQLTERLATMLQQPVPTGKPSFDREGGDGFRRIQH